MYKMMRTILVAFLVATLTISPATACHFCGGYGGGYYSGGGYYGGGNYVGCNGCQSGYYESYSSSCCGGEVVVSEGCEGCEGCGEAAMNSQGEPQMAAPEPPAHENDSMPSTVNRVPSEPAPSLPPQALPSTTDTEMHSMPPVEAPVETPAALPETYAPPATDMPTAETPAVEPPATETTTPPAESTDDLFNTPSTEAAPLPAEEPATPSETDDFFSSPAESATDPAATTPTTESSTQPTDDDLFAPPADEEKPVEEEKPAEETETPAADTDDLFNNTETILRMPGGLASHSLRHWVDNTGDFSCEGRLVRMLDGKVQLLKANGRTTTVPLARLSQGDLEFVNRQASAQQAEEIGKTAQASTGWSN